MRRLPCVKAMCIGLCAALLLTAGGMVVTAQADDDEGTWALTAKEAMTCIQAALSATALSAQASSVKEVEAEDEEGQQLCEVKLVDATGKRSTVHVDVTTNQVVKIK